MMFIRFNKNSFGSKLQFTKKILKYLPRKHKGNKGKFKENVDKCDTVCYDRVQSVLLIVLIDNPIQLLKLKLSWTKICFKLSLNAKNNRFSNVTINLGCTFFVAPTKPRTERFHFIFNEYSRVSLLKFSPFLFICAK